MRDWSKPTKPIKDLTPKDMDLLDTLSNQSKTLAMKEEEKKTEIKKKE